MDPSYRQAVLSLAGRLQQGQPIPPVGDRFWLSHGITSAIDQTDVIMFAQDIVAESLDFSALAASQTLADVFPDSFGNLKSGTFGPSNSQDATIWARVAVDIGGRTQFFSVKTQASWSDKMADIDILLEDAIDDLVSQYAAFGGGTARGTPTIVQVTVY